MKNGNKKTSNSTESFQMAVAPKTDGWFNGTKYIPFDDMTDDYLQNAKLNIQKKELKLWNRLTVMDIMIDKLDEEAARRGLSLRDYQSTYHQNTRRAKNVVKKNQVQNQLKHDQRERNIAAEHAETGAANTGPEQSSSTPSQDQH